MRLVIEVWAGGTAQLQSGAVIEQYAVALMAAAIIINAVAVALIEPLLGTEAPDCMLDKAWEDFREIGIEPSRVYSLGHPLHNGGTSATAVALGSVRMLATHSPEYSRSGKIIVNQRVDGDEICSGGDPSCPLGITSQQQG
jgi:hypothetical protein